MNQLQQFDIRNKTDRLNILKEESTQLVCECPVCGGHRLTVSKKTGAYKCWSGQCVEKEIRGMIAPLNEQKRPLNPRIIHQRANPKAPNRMPPVPLPDQLVLATLPEPPTDIPQKQRRPDRERGEVWELFYRYSSAQEVVRTEWADSSKPKGYDKAVIPYHLDSEGKLKKGKGEQPYPLYREDEALQHGIGKWVVLPEGESCVEICRALQIVGVTFQGADWNLEKIADRLLNLKKAGVAGVLCLPDHDEAGREKTEKVEAAAAAGMPLLVIPPLTLWNDMPDKGDIVDWVKWGQDQGMDQEDFIRILEEQFHAAAAARIESESADDSDPVVVPDSLNPDTEFTQRALSFLYGDKPWISADDKLYFWTGAYYKYSPDAVERPKIASFCNSYPVQQKDGSIRYPYAKPSKVREALQWVKDRLEVDSSLLDPPGLNCTNGVLQLSWDGSKPSWRLVDHNPALYYTYEPIVTYNPNADSTDCDCLLEALEPQERKIFLRTTAASLDLKTVRRYKGRLVRGLLLKGHGSNGKDTLRECVAAMYGYRGMTGATLTDFASYDQGRKFPLARLNNSRVNWASENANTAKLDKIQSLKAFITGDPISIEGKGKDEFEFIPVGVALFNVNDTPNLQGTLEAIQSRYGILTFNKTFKIGADPSKGELEADPRFKYDPDFLRSEVLPAFLNHVLNALVRLMSEGIDYSCTQQALENIQAENSHLFQFCQEVGIGYDPNGTVSAGEIWERLEAWYVDNGTLTYEESSRVKKKSLWVDQARRDDANVKGANQVIARFQNLFPKAKRVTVGKGKMALQGISFSPVYPKGEPVCPVGEAGVSQLVSQKPLPSKDGEPVAPVFLLDEEKVENKPQSFEQCDQNETQKEDRGEKLPRLAHHSDTATDTALPSAPQTASLTGSTASPLPQCQELSTLTDTQPEPTLAAVERDAIAVPSTAPRPDGPTLKIGDTLFSPSGRVVQIAKLASGGWLTSDGCHISRNDLKEGIYTLVAPKRTQVQEDALMLSDEGIGDYSEVRALTQYWTHGHKCKVWKLLSPELRQKYQDLRRKP